MPPMCNTRPDADASARRTRQTGIVGQFEGFLTVFDRRGHIATRMRELREIDQDDISPINRVCWLTNSYPLQNRRRLASFSRFRRAPGVRVIGTIGVIGSEHSGRVVDESQAAWVKADPFRSYADDRYMSVRSRLVS